MNASGMKASGISEQNFSASEPVLVLEPGRAERHYWRDIWAYRELFAILAWRDIAVRYKQTVIGAAWAVIRPFLTMVVFTIVFGHLADLPSEGTAPYPILVFAGMLPWFLFSTILGEASNSLVGNANLIRKVYFPRLIVPCAAAVVALVDFAINLALLFGLMLWYGYHAELAHAAAAGFCRAGGVRKSRPGLRPDRAQCQIPRLPPCHPVRGTVRALCVAGRVFERDRAGGVAVLVQSEPGRGGHRRFPLVSSRRRKPVIRPRFSAQPCGYRGASVAWDRAVPPHRAQLCGSAMSRAGTSGIRWPTKS